MTTGDESYAGALAKVFDRGSEAGKILYKLYGGAGTTKQAGNEFSKKNLQSFKDRLRDGGSAAPAVTNEIVKVCFSLRFPCVVTCTDPQGCSALLCPARDAALTFLAPRASQYLGLCSLPFRGWQSLEWGAEEEPARLSTSTIRELAGPLHRGEGRRAARR